MKRRIAILGASGYTGRELLRLVRRHPDLEPPILMSARAGAVPDSPEHPDDPVVEPFDADRFGSVDGVFLAVPHGTAVELAAAALEQGCKVVDLSADLRLGDPALHERTYGPAPAIAAELRRTAVYGLTEHARPAIRTARLVANPGCYPTVVTLPLLPLVRAGLVDLDADVVADCKSGVSGAGKSPTPRTHFGSVHDNFAAYAVGTHRHAPEIHEVLGTDRVLFVPHLLPVFRGILATLWFRPAAGAGIAEVRACLEAAYAKEPFVRVYARGLPELAHVQRTNLCDIGVAECGGRIVLVAAIDNLVKGAAGQALQNLNLMLGLPETAGLA